MTDLDQAGKLDETLVVVAAEFGRSPKITKSNAGREHWPDCYSVLFAGGGIKGGQVYGPIRQDRRPAGDEPGDARRLHRDDLPLPWIDPSGEMHDQGGRPFALSKGAPIEALIG